MTQPSFNEMLNSFVTSHEKLDDQSLETWLEARNSDGHSLLTLSCVNGDEKLANLLAEKGAKLEQQTPDGRTALMWAAIAGNRVLCLSLVKKGANLWHVCKEGLSVFVYFCRGKDNSPIVHDVVMKRCNSILKEMKKERETYVLQQREACCHRCLKTEWKLQYFEKLTPCRCSSSRRYCSDKCKKADWVSGHFSECFRVSEPGHTELHNYRKLKSADEEEAIRKLKEDKDAERLAAKQERKAARKAAKKAVAATTS